MRSVQRIMLRAGCLLSCRKPGSHIAARAKATAKVFALPGAAQGAGAWPWSQPSLVRPDRRNVPMPGQTGYPNGVSILISSRDCTPVQT